jgi:hypothetical protein
LFVLEWIDNQKHVELLLQSEKALPTSPSIFSSQKSSFRNRRKSANYYQLDIHNIPFELHAYEALLTTVKSVESQQLENLTDRVQNILHIYKTSTFIALEVQTNLKQYKNDLSQMLNRLEKILNALKNIVEDDQDMALMNLTLLKDKPSLYR